MEMGSSSLVTSGACASGSSDSSIDGLKFGKKIYFEDVGSGGVSAKTSGSGSKKGKGVAQGGGQQPPRCQVEGCKADLSGSKAYYCRHKVCGMHSKSPKVIVAGFEQRFCQQCSRFHQLSEFDQGKRSCRRRLAGHNERRRKPPPGSLLSRFGRLSSYHEDSRVGGFLMDFSYPKLTDREQWPTIRTGDRVLSNHTTAMGKCIPHQIPRSLETPANVFTPGTYHSNLQVTVGGTKFSAQGIPTGESFAGVSNSSCALSLLSDQPWGSRNQAPAITGNNFMEGAVPPMVNPMTHNAFMSNFTSNPWNFKGHETGSSSHEVPSKSGLGQLPESICGSQLPSELELSQHGSRQDMDLGPLWAYGPSRQQMHWPL